MRILNSQRFANIAQNTMTAIAIETTLKACGRPTFICLDKNTSSESKKYSATKEFLYQLLCLGTYLTIIPQFKKGGYYLAKKMFQGEPAVKKVFENCNEPLAVGKGKIVSGYKRFMHEFTEAKKTDSESSEMKKIKGGIEAVSIVGSVLGLAVVAPQISNLVLHPIMDALGFKNNKEPETKLNKKA